MKQAEYKELSAKIQKGITEGVRKAVEGHKKANQESAIWKDGHVVKIPPDEIEPYSPEKPLKMIFNQLIPEFNVSNLARSLAFYVDALGFKIEYQRIETKFCFLSKESCQIMLVQDTKSFDEENKENWITGKLEYPRGRGINFQIEVNSINELRNELTKSGYNLYAETKEKWRTVGDIQIGEIEFLVQDPDGYLLRFSETIGERIASS